MKFFEQSPDEYALHRERLLPVKQGEAVKRSLCRTDPVYFVVNQLGIRPYAWQAKFLDELKLGKDTMACTARQVGKTAAIAWFCLWSIVYNTLPLESTKKTRGIIVSATEEQSKKIVADIKEFMRVGDEQVFKLTGGKIKDWFTNQMDRSQGAANTKSSITLLNGCMAISLPPTERARGYTGSYVFIDEAAFIEEADIYESTLQPIVSKTGGFIGMTSTPNGRSGFFFSYFDPDDMQELHTFSRLWVPYQSLRLDDPKIVGDRDEKKLVAGTHGNERQFAQEHEASFNSSVTSFFDPDMVDKGTRKTLQLVESYDKPCDLGVDFGKTVSRTVVSITCLDRDTSGPVIRLLYHFEYPPEADLSLVEDLQGLYSRFNVQRMIFEDCPQAEAHRQAAVKAGLPIVVFNPSRDKAKKYFAFRSWLAQGKLKFPEQLDLIKQMKGLIQEDTQRTTRIYHGPGLRDDRIDSFMMSTTFFTEEKPRFRVWDIEDE